MSTVVYLPQNQNNVAGALGGAFGQGFQEYVKRTQQIADSEKFQAALNGINAAPDQTSANQVVAAAAKGVTDPNKLSLLFHSVSQKFPPGSQEAVKVQAWDTTTGDQVETWIKREDQSKLKDPMFMAGAFGRPSETLTLAKPSKIFEYVRPSSGESTGTFVPGMNPQGTITKDDFERNRQIEADKRAAKKLHDAEENAVKREERLAKGLGKLGSMSAEDRQAKTVSTEQVRLKNLASEYYGAKTLQDGSLDLSSLDEPKRKEFMAVFDRGSQLIEDGKVKTHGQAFRQARKEMETNTGVQPHTPPVVAKPGTGDAKLPKGIPTGSKMIGKTPDGKDVYQAPDGKKYVE